LSEWDLSITKKRIVVVGAGGHAKVVIDAIWAMGEFEIVGVVDPKPANPEVLGVSVLGGDEELPSRHPSASSLRARPSLRVPL
jgi:UDP-perosamine 4-acetyltransferase